MHVHCGESRKAASAAAPTRPTKFDHLATSLIYDIGFQLVQIYVGLVSRSSLSAKNVRYICNRTPADLVGALLFPTFTSTIFSFEFASHYIKRYKRSARGPTSASITKKKIRRKRTIKVSINFLVCSNIY